MPAVMSGAGVADRSAERGAMKLWRGATGARRRPARVMRGLTVAVALLAVITMLLPGSAVPAVRAEPPVPPTAPGGAGGLPAGADAVPGRQKPVPVSAVPQKAQARSTVRGWTAPAVAWPKAGTAKLDVRAAAASSARPGGLPVSVRSASSAASPSAASVRVSVADQQLADRAGVKGVVFSLAPTGGAGGKVDVGVDYSAFAGAYGGDFGARLRLVSLPAC